MRIYSRNILEAEIVALSERATYGGRLIELADRNGYGFDLNYKGGDDGIDEEMIAVSPEIQWQLSTATDSHGRQASFEYNPEQQSGVWAISRITLPNGSDVDYTYNDGRLTQVDHPDETVSTFIYGTSETAQTTTIEFHDAAGDATRQHKTAWLTNNIVCLLYTSPSPRDKRQSRMPSSA